MMTSTPHLLMIISQHNKKLINVLP